MNVRWLISILAAVPFVSVAAPEQQSAMSSRSGSGSYPEPWSDSNSLAAHQQLVQKAKQGGIDVFFVGDSITRRWGATDPQYQPLLENWKTNFFGWNAANPTWGIHLARLGKPNSITPGLPLGIEAAE